MKLYSFEWVFRFEHFLLLFYPMNKKHCRYLEGSADAFKISRGLDPLSDRKFGSVNIINYTLKSMIFISLII